MIDLAQHFPDIKESSFLKIKAHIQDATYMVF